MFDKVIIRNRTEQKENIHLSVHPFRSRGLRMMLGPGHYDETSDDYKGDSMPEWQRKLADSLWENIPGIQTLFFGNGQITIQHAGVFEDGEITEAAINILRPALETQLLLESL